MSVILVQIDFSYTTSYML